MTTTMQTSLPLIMAALLAASAFFSGSETALFGISEDEHDQLSQKSHRAARAVRSLARDQRSLLITIMLGNMAANVLFFVLASVLTMLAESFLQRAAYSVLPLLAIILIGEVAPKLLATGSRVRWCALFARPLLALHRAIAPLRTALNACVVQPAARLAGSTRPASLSADELSELLTLSAQRGVIHPHDADMLDNIVELSELRVGDVMTPRVDIKYVRTDATRTDVVRFARQWSVAQAPVCRHTLDQGVVGVLDLNEYLAHSSSDHDSRIERLMVKPLILPEQAKLDQLLQQLHRNRRDMAIVVDEHGAIVGLVAFEDIIRRITRGLHTDHDEPGASTHPRIIRSAPNQWIVPGRLSVHDLAEALGGNDEQTAGTVAGLIHAKLGRLAMIGDRVQLGQATLEVKTLKGRAIDEVIVTLPTPPGEETT